MRKLILASLIAATLSGCTSPVYESSGKVYKDYGLFNQQQNYDQKIQYEPNWWNICMAAFFFEMIVPPIYVLGFHLMEPVGTR